MSSQGVPKCDRYALAAVKNGTVHLTPLSAIVQMRPSLNFLDKADSASKARVKAMEKDDGNCYCLFTCELWSCQHLGMTCMHES